MTGTTKLVRLILRRDRFIMPLWIILIAVLPISYVASYSGLYKTPEEIAHFADLSRSNITFLTLYGPLFGSTLGDLVVWRAGFIPVVIALISILTVIRHTRVEEESGRRELVGSGVVGRHAGLAAALVTTFLANLVLAGLTGLCLLSQGLGAAGSFAFGFELAIAGWVFGAIGAIAAQLTSGAGSARGISITVLGFAYALRVVGDLSAEADGGLGWVSNLSPIHWAQEMRPFTGDRWWVVAATLGASVALAALAFVLSGRRDVGAGLLPPRLGPATAAASLRSPLALAWRMHRGLLVGWSVGFAALGLVLGGAARSVADLFKDSPELMAILQRLGGTSGVVDAYLAGMLGFLGLVAAAYAIQATLRMRAEETSTRAEPVLSTGVGRLRWAASHLFFAILGPAAALVAAGLAIGIVHGMNVHDVGGQVPRVLTGALVQLPAVWVLAAVAVALFGLLPRLAAAVSWGALTVCLLVGLVGAALELNQRLLDVSPFTHVPKVPGPSVSAVPLVWLLVVAIVVTAAGLVGFRRRDTPVL